MNPEAVVLPVLLALAAAVLGLRAFAAPTRSGRLGRAAAACGVGGLAPGVLGPSAGVTGGSAVLTACGVAAVTLAVLAVGLAVWAFRARRRDAGVGAAYPLISLGCGAISLVVGASLLMAGAGTFAAVGGVPREWRSAEHGFAVTVPSERWQQQPNQNVLAYFAGTRPTLVAMVAEARPAATDAEFEAALAFGRRVKADTPTTATDERDGPNPHGRPHWLYMGEVRAAGKQPYFFGVSVTRVNGRAVVLMFEGPLRLASEVGRIQEAAALRAQADQFLGSVR